MKSILLFLFLFITSLASAQDRIEWDEKYKLELSDFASPGTEIGNTNSYSISSAIGFSFSFAMSRSEFMFTKNFNTKVDCSFNKQSSYVLAPDSGIANNLVSFAQYQFDLSELYARKFRKKLYEEKGAFSNVQFFQPIYDEIQKEFNERYVVASKTTELGQQTIILKELRQEVLEEIELLSDFCKSCKPPKKKKK